MSQFITLCCIWHKMIKREFRLSMYKYILWFLIIIFFSWLCFTDDESEFSYDRESENGPAHWGEIHPEWKMCNYGKLQSPIDLLNERVEIVSHLGRLHRSYKASSYATLLNRGHDMMVIFSICLIRRKSFLYEKKNSREKKHGRKSFSFYYLDFLK